MAGDCPHGALEASLEHYHHDAAVSPTTVMVSTNHDPYLQIIDDLKNDLEQMSCEVVKVQNEYWSQEPCIQESDMGLATSLQELETQNDRLEQALKLQTETSEATHKEMETNNQNLKCQIDQLKKAIAEREQKIAQLTAVVKRISHTPQIELSSANGGVAKGPAPECRDPPMTTTCFNCSRLEKRVETLSNELDKSQRQEHFLHSETRKLNEELNESKRKNANLSTQSHRLASLLKSQESHRMELAQKYDELERNYEEQAKQLRATNAQINVLNERFKMMEKSQNEHNMERNLLREEVNALKEKEAVVVGKHKSLQEHLLKAEKELYAAHDVIRDQKNIMKSNELVHAEQLMHLKDDNLNLKRQFACLTEDHKKLKEAYEREQEICRQSEKLIESFRRWKESQLRAEAKMREDFEDFEKHIQLLLKEKNEMANDYRTLYEDYKALEIEMERLRRSSFSLSNPQLGHFLSERTLAERVEFIRQTKKRLAEQHASLREQYSEFAGPSETSKTECEEKSGE